MKVLYINDELATADGSNYHALGIYQNLIALLGIENVRSFPRAVDGSATPTGHSSLAFREKHRFLLQGLRFVRKTILSYVRSHKLVRELKAENFTPTHILARSVLFDSTALLVAKHFSATLVYEVNTPMYYEHCVINKLPLQKAVERWERNILDKSHGVYTVSAVCRDMLCAHYRLSPEKFMIVPNGYMEELYPANLEDAEQTRTTLRREEKLTDKFVVAFIGSLKSWHGIDRLCGIAECLEAHPQIHFLVAGDGSEHALIEEYCTTHTNMTYKGKLSLKEMANYLLASDLGIMPYHTMENFYFSPLKMYDMIGACLPFLGTGQGQIAEICERYLGPDFLLKNSSPTEAANQILLLSESKELPTSMKKKLFGVRQHFTWHARTEQVVEYLKRFP